MRSLPTVLVLLTLLLPLGALAETAPAPALEAQRVAIMLDGLAPEDVTRAVALAGGRVTWLHEGAGFAVAEVPRPERLDLPFVPDAPGWGGLVTSTAPVALAANAPAPADPYWDRQWGPQALDMPTAWALESGHEDVIVAIVDSGIDRDHPDFAGTRILPGRDYVRDHAFDMPVMEGARDDHGHGTHIAGIIAATRGNDVGIAGMADVTLLPLRVLDGNNRGSCLDFAIATVDAADSGADVINLSLYCGGEYPPMGAGSLYASMRGALVVGITGNDQYHNPSACVRYPGAYPWVMAVTALDRTLGAAYYSCRGEEAEIAAPGSAVLSTLPGNRYASWYGTSMAAPHVAAAAALVKSAAPDLPAADLRALLVDTARDLGDAGRDEAYGHGLVQPVAALEAATAS